MIAHGVFHAGNSQRMGDYRLLRIVFNAVQKFFAVFQFEIVFPRDNRFEIVEVLHIAVVHAANEIHSRTVEIVRVFGNFKRNVRLADIELYLRDNVLVRKRNAFVGREKPTSLVASGVRGFVFRRSFPIVLAVLAPIRIRGEKGSCGIIVNLSLNNRHRRGAKIEVNRIGTLIAVIPVIISTVIVDLGVNVEAVSGSDFVLVVERRIRRTDAGSKRDRKRKRNHKQDCESEKRNAIRHLLCHKITSKTRIFVRFFLIIPYKRALARERKKYLYALYYTFAPMNRQAKY